MVTSSFAAVVDGSTSKGTWRPGGHTTGYVAMQTVCAAIATMPAQSTMAQALEWLTDAINKAYDTYHLPPHMQQQAENRLTCSAAILSRERNEVWLIGDCQCRFGGTTYSNPKLIDKVLANVRSDVAHWLIGCGHTIDQLRHNDLSRQYIMPWLREQCHFQNTRTDNPFAYAVLDGSRVNPAQVRVLPTGTASHIVLATDGYPLLCDTLQASEQSLKRLLESDPLCIDENMSTKGMMSGANSFDDRTFLKIQL